jgi:simple sugar transport system permease protein
MKFWNIGAEGQIIIGWYLATYFALYWTQLPHVVATHYYVFGRNAGWRSVGLIPAYFKTKFDTNETCLPDA